jgi:alpha-glucosidase
MREFAAVLPWTVTAAQWNLLGSHDTARIRTLVESPEMLEVAVGLLLTYPGTPMIFAGDEVGATGTTGEHARVTMPWDRPDDWDAATFALYRDLIALRRGSRALRHGGLRWWLAEDDVVAFLRETTDERVLVVAARAPWSGAGLPPELVRDRLPEALHGSAPARADDGRVLVPGVGPALTVWRLA